MGKGEMAQNHTSFEMDMYIEELSSPGNILMFCVKKNEQSKEKGLSCDLQINHKQDNSGKGKKIE